MYVNAYSHTHGNRKITIVDQKKVRRESCGLSKMNHTLRRKRMLGTGRVGRNGLKRGIKWRYCGELNHKHTTLRCILPAISGDVLG